MSARPATDPVPAPVAATGSRRPGPLVVLAVGVITAALVRGLLVESYHVPSAANAPTFEPGDRVLVLKTDRRAEAGDVALVDDDGALRLTPSTDLVGTGAHVVGTVVWRFWPLDRLGPVSTSSAPVAP
ncbi:S24/S26 family peptidase [Phycicoccus sonneratiae]|uniref:S24/S26 family peptidase n=1 Tax=Phycicoccus sonneratiae TaxID=2807628 RepID=A0ABS2CKL4_9MICO|nr:S24/S26 family peptidase [Phycicoccus sonneraticus]MBM6400432.1 S24/S26 family peptidase [Phycicoccus sonneraticus]